MTTDDLVTADTAIDPVIALVVVDLQKGVLGFPYTHPISDVATNAGALASAFRRRGLPVVLTLVDGVATDLRADEVITAPQAAMPADWRDPVDAINTQPGDHLVGKHRWGAFTDTDLEAHLRQLGVTQLVLTGVATGFGVESTARHAVELGFRVTVVTDAVTDMDARVHDNSVSRIFPRLGQCRSTRQVLAALEDSGLSSS